MLGVGTLVFFMVRLIPGDVVDTMFADAESWDPQVAERMRALFGLNKPLPLQFWDWLSAVLQGNLGYSLRTKTSVSLEIAHRMPATLELAVGALLIGVMIAIPSGVLSFRLRKSSTRLYVRQ